MKNTITALNKSELALVSGSNSNLLVVMELIATVVAITAICLMRQDLIKAYSLLSFHQAINN